MKRVPAGGFIAEVVSGKEGTSAGRLLPFEELEVRQSAWQDGKQEDDGYSDVRIPIFRHEYLGIHEKAVIQI